MKVTITKVDDANIIMSATIPKEQIDKNIDKVALDAGKHMKVDGFRKGKVPAHIVKKLHGEKLVQDAEAEALREVMNTGSKEAGLKPEELIGEPTFKKFEKTDSGINVEIEVSIKPKIDLGDYSDLAPKFDKPVIADAEVMERLEGLATSQAPFEKIARKRALKKDDMAVIDFAGSIDGVPFDGGTAEKFSLRIGSGQFIPGFEDQMIGMKPEETKTITVTFPESYGAAALAGKEANFEVTLHEIQHKATPAIDDELAKKLLQGTEGASLDMLKEKIKEQLEREQISKLYNDELKPKIVDALVAKYTFALPNNIVEQEIDGKINQRASQMSEEELNGYKENPEKIETLRAEVREEAEMSVRATFAVDALAREEKITVSDDEVSQALYYEAVMSGQDPQKVMEYYTKNNLLPAIKMGIIEDKLFGKLLGIEA